MAHFRGTVQGNRSEASRLGSKNSGLDVTANGWNVGVSVYGFHEPNEKRDAFRITATGGSNGGDSQTVAYVKETDSGFEVIPA